MYENENENEMFVSRPSSLVFLGVVVSLSISSNSRLYILYIYDDENIYNKNLLPRCRCSPSSSFYTPVLYALAATASACSLSHLLSSSSSSELRVFCFYYYSSVNRCAARQTPPPSFL